MNRKTSLRNMGAGAARFYRTTAAKVGAAGTAALVFSPMAFAGAADPGAAILAEVNTAATTVGGILVVLAGVVGMFILWSYLKRAK